MGMFENDLWYDGNIDYHVYFNGVMMEYPMEIDHEWIKIEYPMY